MTTLLKFTQFLIWILPSQLLVSGAYWILMIKKYRKQVINNNYKSTMGSGSSQNKFEDFYKKCMYNIARVMVETVKFSKSKASLLSYSNISELEKQCNRSNGLILMASHYGNWELACTNLPLHTALPCYGVYKPLKNKTVDKELIHLRSRFGLNLVPMNAIARTMAKNNASSIPAIYILIADQNPRSIQNVEWVQFLGIPTAFSNGLSKLQYKYNFPVAYMEISPKENIFSYSIRFRLLNNTENKSALKWYSECVENQIRKVPHHWLWSHKRWKRKYKN